MEKDLLKEEKPKLKQPWHEKHHKNRWLIDSHISSFLEQHWGWLPRMLETDPPSLPVTYGHITFGPDYFEKVLERKESLAAVEGAARRAEARKLAYELWVWREIYKQKEGNQ